jgi:hypothetical protein
MEQLLQQSQSQNCFFDVGGDAAASLGQNEDEGLWGKHVYKFRAKIHFRPSQFFNELIQPTNLFPV